MSIFSFFARQYEAKEEGRKGKRGRGRVVGMQKRIERKGGRERERECVIGDD